MSASTISTRRLERRLCRTTAMSHDSPSRDPSILQFDSEVLSNRVGKSPPTPSRADARYSRALIPYPLTLRREVLDPNLSHQGFEIARKAGTITQR